MGHTKVTLQCLDVQFQVSNLHDLLAQHFSQIATCYLRYHYFPLPFIAAYLTRLLYGIQFTTFSQTPPASRSRRRVQEGGRPRTREEQSDQQITRLPPSPSKLHKTTPARRLAPTTLSASILASSQQPHSKRHNNPDSHRSTVRPLVVHEAFH